MQCPHCGQSFNAHATDQPAWSPAVAAVLNLIIPGAGHIYMGEIVTGILNIIVAPFAYLTCWICAGSLASGAYERTGQLNPLLACFTLFLLALPILAHLSMVLHPFRVAKKMKRSRKR